MKDLIEALKTIGAVGIKSDDHAHCVCQIDAIKVEIEYRTGQDYFSRIYKNIERRDWGACMFPINEAVNADPVIQERLQYIHGWEATFSWVVEGETVDYEAGLADAGTIEVLGRFISTLKEMADDINARYFKK